MIAVTRQSYLLAGQAEDWLKAMTGNNRGGTWELLRPEKCSRWPVTAVIVLCKR